jgi:hypothetical protein
MSTGPFGFFQKKNDGTLNGDSVQPDSHSLAACQERKAIVTINDYNNNTNTIHYP